LTERVAHRGWELWEWTADALAGTDLSAGIADTTLDLIADAVGAADEGTRRRARSRT
jgi:hypothetical protein